MNELLKSYAGIYPTGSKNGSVKLLVHIPGLGQKYVGTFAPMEEGLEAWNNLAHYLNCCGRGLHIPLQGPEEMQSKYVLPRYIKPENAHEFFPPPTATTELFVREVEENLPQVIQTASPVSIAALPGTVLRNLRAVQQELQTITQDFNARVANLRSRFNTMVIALDPEQVKIAKEFEDLFTLALHPHNIKIKSTNPAEQIERLVAKHLQFRETADEFFAAHPEVARP